MIPDVRLLLYIPTIIRHARSTGCEVRGNVLDMPTRETKQEILLLQTEQKSRMQNSSVRPMPELGPDAYAAGGVIPGGPY